MLKLSSMENQLAECNLKGSKSNWLRFQFLLSVSLVNFLPLTLDSTFFWEVYMLKSCEFGDLSLKLLSLKISNSFPQETLFRILGVGVCWGYFLSITLHSWRFLISKIQHSTVKTKDRPVTPKRFKVRKNMIRTIWRKYFFFSLSFSETFVHKLVICGGGRFLFYLIIILPVIHNKLVFLIIFICRFGLLYQFCCMWASNGLENARFW